MRATICNGCGRTVPGDRASGRCERCERDREARRQSPEQRRIYDSTLWRRIRELAKRRDGGCVACGSTVKLSVHHRTPIRAGGDPYDLANLETLCSRCHALVETGGSPARGHIPAPRSRRFFAEAGIPAEAELR